VLDLLLPQRCLACLRPGAQICDACRLGLRLIGPPLCARCGAPTAWPVERCRECSGRRLSFGHARAAVEYDEAIRRVVAGWKERGLRGIAAWAAEIVVATCPRPDVRCIVPVPADRDRWLKRGHHAATGLARELGTRWKLPVEPLLMRTGPSTPQRGLDDASRRRNVREAFRAEAAPRVVLLVDDVYTTGATANAAAAALRKAGARRVEVVTFARTIRVR
jgi:predicted amidophosphoribosyltransferase